MTIDLDPRVASGGELSAVDSSAGTDGENLVNIFTASNNQTVDVVNITSAGVLNYLWLYPNTVATSATCDFFIIADGITIMGYTSKQSDNSVCFPFLQSRNNGSGKRFTVPLYFGESLKITASPTNHTQNFFSARFSYYLLES